MRRLLAAAALAATVAAGAACDANTPSKGGPAASGAPVASSAAELAANTKAVCEAAGSATTEGITTLLTELGTMISASSSNDTAGADAARARAKAALAKISADLRAQAAKAEKPELRAALEKTAKLFDTMGLDVEHIDQTTFDQSSDEMDKLCG